MGNEAPCTRVYLCERSTVRHSISLSKRLGFVGPEVRKTTNRSPYGGIGPESDRTETRVFGDLSRVNPNTKL